MHRLVMLHDVNSALKNMARFAQTRGPTLNIVSAASFHSFAQKIQIKIKPTTTSQSYPYKIRNQFLSHKTRGPEQFELQESRWADYCGQPNHETHPHLLAPHDIIPGFSAADYRERQTRLVSLLLGSVKVEATTQSVPTNLSTQNGILLVRAACRQYMAHNIPHLFRQNSDFLYLTGCKQPEALLVMAFNGSHIETALFMPPVDNLTETWDGPQLSTEAAITYFGMDTAFPLNELPTYLTGLSKRFRKEGFCLFYDKNSLRLSDEGFKHGKWLKEGMKLLTGEADLVNSPTYWIQQLRVVKSVKEIELMRKACKIATDAISKTMKATEDGLTEHQIEAMIEYECKMKGASHLAYPPVVASGPRASVIHYGRNDQLLNSRDLLLVDAGCEYFGYCSDITRTWPVHGKFSAYHLELYQMLLEVQESLIETALGRPSLDQLFQVMCRKLGQGLKQLQWPAAREVNASQLHRLAYSLCPHHVGHYLGMDVHDCSQISRNVPLEEGMVFTIEPGIYVSGNNTAVPMEFRGLGIRIEDDLVVTSPGLEVLTRRCPKTVEEIEACMKSSS